MSKQQRSKFWAFIVYPESCNLNRFIEDMTNYRVPYAISPLHDKDLDKDGNIKKAHYHIILAYDNPISYNTVSVISFPFPSNFFTTASIVFTLPVPQ